MKILFLTNIPSPYRLDFFNELGKWCELTVAFERESSSERDSSWKHYKIENFTPIFLKGIKWGYAGAFCPEVVNFLRKNKYDHIIVTNFTSPTGMLAIVRMRARKIPYWLESDGGFAKDHGGIKEKIKNFFIKDAAGYFSTAEEHDKYYLQYGAQPDRLIRYPFTSLHKADILSKPVPQEQKCQLRKELDITETKIIVAVGQFVPRKGFDILIDAMALLPSYIGCYIIGGQPTQEYIDQVSKHGVANVHFVGFQKKADLMKYYLSADLFVHPTREDIWGLVVNEAMANGLPVITTDRCIAGLELIKDPAIGAIVPVGNAKLLAEAICNTFERIDDTTAYKVLDVIRGYSFEEMVRRHNEVLREQL